MNKLEALLTELDNMIAFEHLADPSISASSIGWHIEHCLLTLNLVVEKVKESDPSAYKPKFHFWKLAILVLQRIPRKKVKAPKIVQPKNDHTKESLKKHIAIARENINSLETLNSRSHFFHPFLGVMNLRQTSRFLKIHTKHHLHIMNEIKQALNQ